MNNLGIKGRLPIDLHRGCIIRGRIYTNNVLVGIIVKDGGQTKALYFI